MVKERSWWRLTEHVPQGQAPAARVNDDILLINTILTADSLCMVEENKAIIQFLAYDWVTINPCMQISIQGFAFALGTQPILVSTNAVLNRCFCKFLLGTQPAY